MRRSPEEWRQRKCRPGEVENLQWQGKKVGNEKSGNAKKRRGQGEETASGNEGEGRCGEGGAGGYVTGNGVWKATQTAGMEVK